MLTFADLHQSPLHFRNLPRIINAANPDVVALVGDFLDLGINEGRVVLTIKEVVACLSAIKPPLICVRGNHEDHNWTAFAEEWEKSGNGKELHCLDASTYTLGPLTIVGFPCPMGDDAYWCLSLPKTGNILNTLPKGRHSVGYQHDKWMKPLQKRLGPAGRMCWLLHIPPVGRPIAHPEAFSPWFCDLVDKYLPMLTISGHDHATPLRHSTWNCKEEQTICVNVGQGGLETFYACVDFQFEEGKILPPKITVTAMPGDRRIEIACV